MSRIGDVAAHARRRHRPLTRSLGWVALTLFLALITGGCVRGAEVNRLAIVDVLGLDAGEDGGILLTAQVIVPTRLGVGPTGAAAEASPFLLARSTGKTVAEAITRLDTKVPRQIFLEHLQLLVLGEELARRGLLPIADFLLREPQVRTDLLVAVAPESAQSVVSLVPPLPALPGEAWKTLVRNERVTVSSVRNLLVSLGEEGMDPFLTAIAPTSAVDPGGSGNIGDIELTGAALFRGDRLVGYLNRQETFGLQILLGDRPRTVLSVTDEEVWREMGMTPAPREDGDGAGWLSEWPSTSSDPGIITLRLTRADSSLSPVSVDPPTLKLRARLETEVANAASLLDIEDSQVAQAVQRAAVRKVVNHVEAALEKMRTLHADAAGLGAKFRRHLPSWWRNVRSHWPQLFAQVQLEYDVTVLMPSTGLATRPAGPAEHQLKVGPGGGDTR